MATIGTFTLDHDGFLKGQIKTLNLSAEVSMEPVESQKEGAPAYRLYAGEVELGAAWAKTAKESGREYHQVRLTGTTGSTFTGAVVTPALAVL